MEYTTLREKWQAMDSMRSEVVDDMFLFAQFTIPSLFPERYYGSRYDYDTLPELYSNKAATNTLTLANTMTSALMPPNDVPFFEMKMSPSLSEEEQAALRDPIAEVERAALDLLQASNLRSAIFQALQHAIVMKDALIFQTEKEKFKNYHPAHFQIRRNGEGEIVEYWTVDWLVSDLLPEDLANVNGGKKVHEAWESEPMYTYIRLVDDKWTVDREFRDEIVESGKTYDILPYYHFGWTPVSGEDYSRSLVEENFATIRSLELVSKALAEGLAAGSEGRILIDPTSAATEDDIIGTANWSIISARPGAIDTFQPNTVGTVGVAVEAKRMYEAELDKAFQTASAADLRGERVTAFQTNQVINERANALSGTLSALEQDLERIVQRVIYLMIQDGELLDTFQSLIDEGFVSISISSGIDALGRQADVVRLGELLNVAYSTQDPSMVQPLNKGNIIRSFARNSGLNMAEFTYTDEQLAEQAQQAQAAQQQQAIQQQALQTGGKVVEQAAAQANQG